MNYLYKNRDNSRKLPFDVMNIIYEYADPMVNVRKQIVNKEYDLDNIMYKRMIKEIEKTFVGGTYWYNLNTDIITPNTLFEERHKQPMLHYYRQHILYYEKYKRRNCGLDRRYDIYCQRTKIIIDLEAGGVKVNTRYSTKQLYKKWLKL